jgi:dTDP-4-amino-4,6-dideoxygalactose transaminase
VLIHYFGYVDPNYQEVISLAKNNDVMILEDEAHALYTDFIGGRSGRLCDAAIFSLHKLLPFPNGGLLCINDRHIDFGDIHFESLLDYPFMKYDLYGIAKKRIENALMVLHLLEKYCDEIVPLKSQLNMGIVPQTVPVMVKRASRDLVYQKMNESGFGVVSLYHTLIDQIDRDRFPNAYNLSKRILNLPIHQDIEQNEVEKMIAKLIEIIRKC